MPHIRLLCTRAIAEFVLALIGIRQLNCSRVIIITVADSGWEHLSADACSRMFQEDSDDKEEERGSIEQLVINNRTWGHMPTLFFTINQVLLFEAF